MSNNQNVFTDHGIPAYVRVTNVSTVTLLYASTPELGNRRSIEGVDLAAIPDGLPQHTLIGADGLPVAAGGNAVGISYTPILAEEVTAALAAGTTINVPYYSAGNFNIEALALDPSLVVADLPDLALIRATAVDKENLIFNTHELSRV